MKVIISGGTGYIGSEVLAECINHPLITSILVLSRRELPDSARNAKVKTILLKDFTSYHEDAANEIKTANAALWCLGTYKGDEKVDIDFPLAFIDLIKARSAESPLFRHVQLSGALTEPPPKAGEQPRSLWYFTTGRRIRGAAEAKVLETTDDSPGSNFNVYVVKPGGIPARGVSFLQFALGESLVTGMKELTSTMVDLAVHGNERKIFSSRQIVEHGKKLAAQSA